MDKCVIVYGIIGTKMGSDHHCWIFRLFVRISLLRTETTFDWNHSERITLSLSISHSQSLNLNLSLSLSSSHSQFRDPARWVHPKGFREAVPGALPHPGSTPDLLVLMILLYEMEIEFIFAVTP